MNQIDKLLQQLNDNQQFSENVSLWDKQSVQEARLCSFPEWIQPNLVDALYKMGIQSLYNHQYEALEHLQNGENIVISTGTASGKSICYQIPILNRLLIDGSSTALLLFPTKALTYDQSNSLTKMISSLSPFSEFKNIISVYDGDTPVTQRNMIRKNSKILLSNPDMVNIAILPHHTIWSEFFQNLKFIVIDEIHLYRGVFGSHISNLIRRIKRIAEFYGSSPQFIMTSATIANPKELACNLIEDEIFSIDDDASPKGEKNFLIFNPPIINQDLGIRESLITATTKIAGLFFLSNVQSLLFCRTRRFVEVLLKELRAVFPQSIEQIRGYRSGYLKKDRREIEEGLKKGSIKLAVATNALELGVDIGGVDAVLLAGYPGSISSLRQRSGRGGRSVNTSISIMIASMNPLDQYFARNPKYLMDRPLEHALINANNPLILLSHIKSAAFELPLEEFSSFGSMEWIQLQEYLDYLIDEGILQKKKNKYYWLSEKYPSSDYSLRSTISERVLLELETEEEIITIGEVDYVSALWMTHPGAVYLHEGETFFVKSLDLEKCIATLSSYRGDYLTEPIISVDINPITLIKERVCEQFILHFGEIEVTTQVTGYKKVQSQSREVLAAENLDLPINKLQTTGFWIELTDKCIELMRAENMWLSDPNDYGTNWRITRDNIRKRDKYTCQACGKQETGISYHVHHKIPFKSFTSMEKANEFDNLVTLCPDCHRLVEMNTKIKSGLSGLKYLLINLAPLLVLCDISDLGSYVDPNAKFSNLKPIIMIYDSIPAGMGLSNSLYERVRILLEKSKELLVQCSCQDGCPSCVGPTSESSFGGKKETLYLLNLLLEEEQKCLP